ncbi:uncharacterized protein [Watersipora subatra]|uniref:uncharacterized protein n=1 Tax=Watersipora subatra TaxID=2589382 RepID=UPI00355ADD41
MEVLSNLSCCFDTSKSIGETSVELVICDFPLSKQCCLRWETITYVCALAFSLADFLADAFGYVSFVSNLEDHDEVKNYITAWLIFLILSGVIVLSEIALPIYSLVKLSCSRVNRSEEETNKFREVTKYWSRANNVLVILTEDGIIAIIRILIAFRSVEAVADLQTTSGVVSSAVAFVVTILRHGLLTIQLITKLSKNGVTFSKCPAWAPGYCTKGTLGLILLFFFTLFLSSCSVGLTGMSMAISAQLIDIYHRDSIDFLLNVTLLGLSVPAVFIVTLFLVIQMRW